MMEELKFGLIRKVPQVSAARKSAYFEALEQEAAAKQQLKDEQSRMAEITKAKALLKHAKGKWIGGADKGIAKANSDLKGDFAYNIDVPEAGTYALVAKVVTPSWKQSLVLSVNGQKNVGTIPLSDTVGMWDYTRPIQVDLKGGKNVLQFSHRAGEVKSSLDATGARTFLS